MNKYYIAYGSNLNKKQMKIRCPTATVVGNGFLYDFALVFRIYATIEPAKGSKVPVTVWRIDEDCERNLDRYEGYPVMYHKLECDIEVECSALKAMVYVMNNDMREYQLPTGYYFNVVLEGYANMGLDEKYIYEAVSRTKKLIKMDNKTN